MPHYHSGFTFSMLVPRPSLLWCVLVEMEGSRHVWRSGGSVHQGTRSRRGTYDTCAHNIDGNLYFISYHMIYQIWYIHIISYKSLLLHTISYKSLLLDWVVLVDWLVELLVEWSVDCYLIHWLIHWLNGWLCFICWLGGWLIGLLVDWLVSWLIEWINV